MSSAVRADDAGGAEGLSSVEKMYAEYPFSNVPSQQPKSPNPDYRYPNDKPHPNDPNNTHHYEFPCDNSLSIVHNFQSEPKL